MRIDYSTTEAAYLVRWELEMMGHEAKQEGSVVITNATKEDVEKAERQAMPYGRGL